jgi:sodium-dependent dicarboxylate transporter 2/3/5
MSEAEAGTSRRSAIGRAVGPLLFAAIALAPTGSLEGPARTVAAVTAWMAVWWVTEAAPLAATSLLPLVLFPLLGVRRVGDVARCYGDEIVFLFLGGFVVALAVERSGLHRRLALAIVGAIGASERRLVLGFLVATAALSMWLSNTATTLMLLPIAAGAVERVPNARAPARIFLAVAYGASIGGIGTLIGTPTNLVLAGMAPNLVPGLPPLGFGRWMLFGVPVVACLVPVAAALLARGLAGGAAAETADALRRERATLGRLAPAERRAGMIFGVTALAWITRATLDFGAFRLPGWSELLPDPKLATDAVPAVAAAVAATLLRSGGGERRPLVTWAEVHAGVPWGVLLLFGGGFALADGVHASGLDRWLASQLHGLAGLPLPLLILALTLVGMFATEFMSNTAAATLLMPILAALAQALGIPPYLLMAPAVVACSCAFMLPVATPPNAIAIGTGRVTAADLFREGLRLNLASAMIVTLLAATLGRLVLPG